MSSQRHGLRASAALCMAMVLLASEPLHAQAAQLRDLYLEVFINGFPTRLIAHVNRRGDGRMAMKADELREIGLKFDERAKNADGLVDLDSLPGVTYRYDEADQALRVGADHSSLLPQKFDARPERLRGSLPAETATGGRGAVVNYLAFGTTRADQIYPFESLTRGAAANVAVDARLFGDFGTLTQTGLAGMTPSDNGGAIRFDTTWSYADPESLVTYRAGDVISGGLTWTRPVRLGGLQVQRSFSLRPDLITMPLPSISGSAAVPSTVDVYVNNLKTYSRQVAPGPFEVSNIPAISGAGTQRLVVRDASGRETSVTQAFFSSPKLLREGLYDFSVETGIRRYSFGARSADYDDDPVASASLRGALSDRLTLEMHGEGAAGLVNGGIGAVIPVSRFGVGSLAVAGSKGDAGQGAQVAAGIELDLWGVRVQARGQHAFGNYSDLASMPGRNAIPGISPVAYAPPRDIYQASASIPFDASSLTVSFTHFNGGSGARQDILGLSYSTELTRRTSLSFSAFAGLTGGNDFGALLGLSRSITPDIGARFDTSTVDGRISGGLEVARAQGAEPGTYGWRLRNREGEFADRAASGSYRLPQGRIAGGVQQFGGQGIATGEFEGAVAMLDGGVFFANRIDDSFAVVDAGAPGIDIYYENRPMGRSDAQGKLLVPQLRSYEINNLSIDPARLPVGAAIGKTRAVVTPKQRNGVVVDFGVITSNRPAVIVLKDINGKPVEVGSRASLKGGSSLTVGYDGQLYLESLQADALLKVERADGSRCAARVKLPRTAEKSGILRLSAVCR